MLKEVFTSSEQDSHANALCLHGIGTYVFMRECESIYDYVFSYAVNHAALCCGRTCIFAGVNAGCCAKSHASTRCTSASDSFTL